MFSGSISDAVQAREAPAPVSEHRWGGNVCLGKITLLFMVLSSCHYSYKKTQFLSQVYQVGMVSKNSAFCRETAGSFNETSTKKGHTGSTERTSVPEKTPGACRADPAAT